MGYKPKFYKFMRGLLGPFFRVIFRVKYINPRNIPTDGPYILAANHISAIDPIIMSIGQRRHVMYMAKAELFKNSFLRWLLMSVGAFPVDRDKKDRSSVRHFEQVLESGDVMGIFIEGTRSKTGELLPPKNGLSLIAYSTKTPVIPVCNTKIKGRRVCHFGEPISLEEMGLVTGGAKEYRAASRYIMDRIKDLREQDLKL